MQLKLANIVNKFINYVLHNYKYAARRVDMTLSPLANFSRQLTRLTTELCPLAQLNLE